MAAEVTSPGQSATASGSAADRAGHEELVVVPDAPAPSPRGRGFRPSRPALLDALVQIVFVAALISVYEGLRVVVEGDRGEALRHAASVWSAERRLHLPSEAAMQTPWLHAPWLARVTNVYYATPHFPVISLTLFWLLLWHRSTYSRVRDLVVVSTIISLVVQAVYPLAPPRMLPGKGLVDLAQRFGPSVYSSDPQTDHVANQYAAMPSLHVGYALLVAIGCTLALRSRWRYLAFCYPLATTTAVLVTANHYWLDVFAGIGTVLVAVVVTWPLEVRRRTVLHTRNGAMVPRRLRGVVPEGEGQLG